MPSHVAPRPRRRRVLGVAGTVLIVGGLGLLGWVGWQFWGTNWQSGRTHRTLVEQAEKAWQRPAKAVDEAEGEDDTDTKPAEQLTTDSGVLSAIIRIPRFGDDYAVPLLEGVDDDDLAAGFGRFTENARPGRPGNFAIAAHRVTHGEPLRDMPALAAGDSIIVETARATYEYVLDTDGDALTVPFTAGWVLGELPQNPDPDGVQPPQDAGSLITITTCAELFHTDDRLVAFGHLVSRTPRSESS